MIRDGRNFKNDQMKCLIKKEQRLGGKKLLMIVCLYVMLFFKDQAAQMTNRHIHREWRAGGGKQNPRILSYSNMLLLSQVVGIWELGRGRRYRMSPNSKLVGLIILLSFLLNCFHSTKPEPTATVSLDYFGCGWWCDMSGGKEQLPPYPMHSKWLMNMKRIDIILPLLERKVKCWQQMQLSRILKTICIYAIFAFCSDQLLFHKGNSPPHHLFYRPLICWNGYRIGFDWIPIRHLFT